MEEKGSPHRLSILGYWFHPDAPADVGRGLPDPNDLRGEWDVADRAATIEALQQGTPFRQFSGTSACRICGESLGSGERTDGVWAWPNGLEHYVEAHAVRLPGPFVARCRAPAVAQADWLATLTPEHWVQGGPESMVPLLEGGSRPWVVDDAAWLEWAAHNTPARPAADAASLEMAREVCRRLSHSTWSADVQPIEGRWRLDLDYDHAPTNLYLQRCAADVLERRLLRLRRPDPEGILTQERTQEIAADFDGSWGSARVLGRHPGAWFVWVKSADAEWPSEEFLQEFLRSRQPNPGWECFHPGGGRSFVVPPLDEVLWRWVLTCQRESAQDAPKTDDAVESDVHDERIQRDVDKLLKRGIVFSILWLAGLGSLIAIVSGWRARRLIMESHGAVRRLGAAWWCIVAGGLGVAIWFPVLIVAIVNNLNPG